MHVTLEVPEYKCKNWTFSQFTYTNAFGCIIFMVDKLMFCIFGPKHIFLRPQMHIFTSFSEHQGPT